MPSPHTVTRHNEIDRLLHALSGSYCAAVVGLSNTGKSLLLRSLRSKDVRARYTERTGRRVAIVYIDCNGLLELSGQGFYELILRNIQESIPDLDEELALRIAEHYNQVVEPDTQFLVPLSFNNALTAIIEEDHRDLVLLFDEFDEVFDALDGRVFLNLRALKDKYADNLIYVTATARVLGSKRSDEQTAEFVELSASHTLILQPMTRFEADELADALARHAGLADGLAPEELDYLWAQAGGHPRMLRASLSHLIELRLRAPEIYQTGGLEAVHRELMDDVTLRSECARMWAQLGPDERDALLAIVRGTEGMPEALQKVEAWGLARWEDDGFVIFADLMADFVRRQASVQRQLPEGVSVDQDSGEVWIEGIPIPPLTELEFKLLSLLHERENKLTDKYQIVETVWGVDYVDEVDDARIEKLVSRLRAKIEPDPGDPRYIITVRGRGYKLTTPNQP